MLSGLLGRRYEIRELLGRGGMGEVYRAFDLKLRVEVALKAVRGGGGRDDAALIRREVRVAREVVSPNVCRIFDLVDEDGLELLSMEYIDGTTLRDVLRDRGPLALPEAREIASQLLAGLEAIHRAGLVHRDVKPENVMISRTGRVVVMDLGVARATTEAPARTISGTPAYMAPEQARGTTVDARADVFSAGVVLAEMLTVGGPDSRAAREALWTGLRETPPRVPESPWAPVLTQALAPEPDARYPSARALAHALEQVTSRVPGMEDTHPYPGLAPFTQDDAAFFFGREAEVEAVWTKLARPRLLGVIGPSGAGKSSFLRAGLLPALPGTWCAAVLTPGPRPFQALAREMAAASADDPDWPVAIDGFEDADAVVGAVARWRSRHAHVLIVVDQFEELFTQNPADAQTAFAQLLGRLVLDADAHVIVALRDDFLARCHGHEALAPILSDLTLLGPLGESGLRRALVQPALACGYHFEDESLVDEMVQAVVKERGALPLLAFAASRLWEKRDREHGVLTRAAYREIGGVAGALAQHAEAMLDRIGEGRIPLVREIFRNLMTAQGTRVVRERGELLSVFAHPAGADARAAAETVLDTLVAARLLTAYDEREDEGGRRQQIEIVHESLLTEWPRLVRWQTQDADGAQLRDQLRQAARAWEERGRSDDLLWSGSAYRDLEVWRERYPGGLSANEEAFAAAARRRAERARRRRRMGVGALLTLAALVAVTTSVLWSRSEASRRQAVAETQRAEAETRRAEAGKLLAIAERELAGDATGALAYAMKSLELADTEAGRLFALRVLQRAPVARVWEVGKEIGLPLLLPEFSPDGRWAAAPGTQKVRVIGRDGRNGPLLGDYPPAPSGWPWVRSMIGVRFGPRNDVLAANRAGDVRVWTIPGGRELRRGLIEAGASRLLYFDGPDAFLTMTEAGDRWHLRSWPSASGEPRFVGSLQLGPSSYWEPDETGRLLFYGASETSAVYVRSIVDLRAPPRLLIRNPPELLSFALSPDDAHLVTNDGSAEIVVRAAPPSTRRERVLRAPTAVAGMGYDPTGRWLFVADRERGDSTRYVFDMTAPPGAEPLTLTRGKPLPVRVPLSFDPGGRWAVTTHWAEAAFWPLDTPRAHVLNTRSLRSLAVAFTPGGGSLLSLLADGDVREWPLRGDRGDSRTVLPAALSSPSLGSLTMDGVGRALALAGSEGRLMVVPLDGGAPRSLGGFSANTNLGGPALSDDGGLVAAGVSSGPHEQNVIRVWNLETGGVRTFGPPQQAGDPDDGGSLDVRFAGRDRLLVAVKGTGLVSLDLSSGRSRLVARIPSIASFAATRDGGVVVASPGTAKRGPGVAFRINMDDGTAEPLDAHGSNVVQIALDPGGTLVATGSRDGTIRVGPVSGEEPHVLFGQTGWILSLAFSPDGRWLAVSTDSPRIYIWPVPDMSNVPLHRRPLDALLGVLRTHTNLRAVPDSASPTGYVLKPDPFPGWATLPEW